MTRTSAPSSPRENPPAGNGTRSLQDDNAPIVMVICADPERLRELRQRLRCEGFLTAAARSPNAALALLTQVQVDGCVVSHPLDGATATAISQSLNRVRPNCPKLLLPETGLSDCLEWLVCQPAVMANTLRQCFCRMRGR